MKRRAYRWRSQQPSGTSSCEPWQAAVIGDHEMPLLVPVSFDPLPHFAFGDEGAVSRVVVGTVILQFAVVVEGTRFDHCLRRAFISSINPTSFHLVSVVAKELATHPVPYAL